MRVFITGASGFIGSSVITELLGAGHTVLGLARSDKSADALKKMGVDVQRGSLEDLESLKEGARQCDGVIHCAFDHDFSKIAANCAEDKRAIETMGSILVGSGKRLIITSVTGMTPGRLRTEEDPPILSSPQLPRASEEAAANVQAQGVHVSVVRLPQVHDRFKQGLITRAIAIARQKGVAAYVGDGLNRWPAIHRLDCANLYRLVLENGQSCERYNAVAEEGVSTKDIAEAIGRGLKIPVVSQSREEAAEHFGFYAIFMSFDMPTSSALTQERLNWHPKEIGLLEDLAQAHEFETLGVAVV